MQLGDIYPAVLTIVLFGIILGVGLAVLGKLGNTNGMPTEVNTTKTALGTFTDWIGIIVLVIAAAIIIGLVMRSFGAGGRGR